MTREEAIQELQNCKGLIQQDGQDYLDERDIPLLDMAIEALSAKPTIPTFAESAEAYKAWTGEEMGSRSEQYKKGFEDAKRAFELEYAREAESMLKKNAELNVLVNAQRELLADRPHGEWIEFTPSKVYMNGDEAYAYMNNYTCSVCGGEAHLKYNYCPNCGALMGGDGE